MFQPSQRVVSPRGRSCRRVNILIRLFCASLPCPFTGKGACKAGRGLFCLRSRSVPSPFQNRFRSVPYNGEKWDLHRTCMGITWDLLRRHQEYKCEFFLELNDKHVHGDEICMITYCISAFLYACTCLLNTYISRT